MPQNVLWMPVWQLRCVRPLCSGSRGGCSSDFRVTNGRRSSSFRVTNGRRSSSFRVTNGRRSSSFRVTNGRRSSSFRGANESRFREFFCQNQPEPADGFHDSLEWARRSTHTGSSEHDVHTINRILLFLSDQWRRVDLRGEMGKPVLQMRMAMQVSEMSRLSHHVGAEEQGAHRRPRRTGALVRPYSRQPKLFRSLPSQP
jgi:hypothetical protein